MRPFLTITAETPLTFDIEVRGAVHLLRMNGGEWRLNKADGSGGVFIAQARVGWTEALARALKEIEAA